MCIIVVFPVGKILSTCLQREWRGSEWLSARACNWSLVGPRHYPGLLSADLEHCRLSSLRLFILHEKKTLNDLNIQILLSSYSVLCWQFIFCLLFSSLPLSPAFLICCAFQSLYPWTPSWLGDLWFMSCSLLPGLLLLPFIKLANF